VEVARARLGRTVGDRWRLERLLGTGGMGAVYAARAPDGSVAALKMLHPEMGARPEVRERFLREGWVAHRIGHPGVVRMLAQGDGEEAFLVMELLEGETLRERMSRHGRLPLEEVLDVAAEVLAALAAAHEHGVIHRDLKPDNLFVTRGGRVKVLDFGLARLLDDVPGQHQTRTGVALGTLAYMAPEQALGRRAEVDGRADLFALGATLFRLISGRRVHEAESEAELLMAMASRPAPPLKAVLPEASAGVAAVIDLALAFARDARYPDARTMLADVVAVRRGGVPPFASARLASREEKTRADLPVFPPRSPLEAPPAPQSQRTQPMPVSQRTVPLAEYAEPTAQYGTPAAARAPAPPAPAPSSTRTEPLVRVPLASAQVSPPLPLPPAQGHAGERRRGLLVWFVVLGALALAAVGAAFAYFALGTASSPRTAASTGSPLTSPVATVSAPASSPTGAAASAVSPVAAPAPHDEAGTRGHAPRVQSLKPHR